MVEMDVALELEDDVFFADLSKQIALLIMDDDDDDGASFPLQNPSVSIQAFSHASQPMASSPFLYEQACTREIRGTGVFIPRSSLPRRKHRTGRSRQQEKPKPASPAAANTAVGSTATNSNSGGQKSFNCNTRKPNGLKKRMP